MGIQRIDATNHNLSLIPNGSMCLTLQSGTGTFEIYLSAERWALLGKSAQWFDQNTSQQELISRLSQERENALRREMEIGSQLRAMTEARNELALKLEQYEQDEQDEEDDQHEPTTVQEEI